MDSEVMSQLLKKILTKIEQYPNSIKRTIYQDKILSHRLIFSINPGRSGSKYLSQLLGTAAEVTSFHEAQPPMVGNYLQMIERKPYEQSLKQRKIKSITIQNQLLLFLEGQVYAESNHMFIKTFFDVILKDFKHTNIQVITLHRNLAQTLKSFIELGYFSSHNKYWPLWFSSPNAITAAIPCIGCDASLDQYDLCIAYLIDIQARAIRFQQNYPFIKNHLVRLENFKNYDYIEELFNQLEITPTPATQEILLKKFNTKDAKKSIQVNLAYCQQRIDRYLEKADLMGIIMPSTLKKIVENE
jgi:hypothetical protein